MIFVWLLLSILAGILLAFSQAFQLEDFIYEPNIFNFLIASVGLVLFMKVSSMRRRWRTRALLGFVTGFIYFTISLFWIYVALRDIGELSILVSVLGLCALSSICALYFAAWSAVAGMLAVKQRPLLIRILLWASLWAFVGVAREYLFTGFSWADPSALFSYLPWIGRSAWVWGLHGISFVWAFSLCLVVHFDEWYPDKTDRIRAFSILSFLGLIIIASNFAVSLANNQSVKIALVQPNIQQDMKWEHNQAKSHLNNLINLTNEAMAENPDLIVWPETSYPYLVPINQTLFPMQTSTPLVVGAVIREQGVNYNTAALIINNERKSFFSKIHLVPFGEYVPFENYLPFEKLVENVGRFIPGDPNQDLLQIDRPNIKMGPLICYEDIFARRSVHHAKKEAQLLLNLTNDGWYKKTSALLQHAAIAQMQVFSTGLPMVRATNTGLSSFITFYGREDFAMHERGTFIAEIDIPPANPSKSLFVILHPWIQWIWLFIFVMAFLWQPTPGQRRIFFRP